ncbi:MAG: prolipoprotein diacylglyceryl transferase [Oscillospiraceae bacterium]|nr:prolipoprotein diacylglyceryl transferase [Oscillospiraceae bacterium]
MIKINIIPRNYIGFPNLGLEFEVGRTAFKVFGLDIYWYGIIVSVAIILGFFYAMKRAGQFGLIADKVFDTAIVGLVGGFICARLYYVIFSTQKYSFTEIFTKIRDGGFAIYGGIIGAILFALVFMKLRKMRILPVLDLAGMSFLLGIGLGRWGNFFNQEAYGAATAGNLPWGMTGNQIASNVGMNALVHPCFLYESLWCILGFIFLHFYSKKLRSFDGEIFLLFAAWYGIGRAFNEQLRSDSLMIGDFKVSQFLAAMTAGAAIGAFIYYKQRVSKNPESQLFRDTEESAELIAAYNEKQLLDKEKADAKKALKEEEAPSILAVDNEPDNVGDDDSVVPPENEEEDNDGENS